MSKENNQLIIAGPCALESHEHAIKTISEAKNHGIDTIRMNLWKPRTEPGFEGVGEAGIPWVREAAEQGLTPAMEVLLAKEAEILMNEILGKLPHATLLLWIGSRNQNHPKQQAIGSAVAGEPRVKLMLKNQPWRDERHWKGMIGHVTHGGASEDQILLCHRGFAPWDKDSEQMRNIPDLAMAEKVQKDTGLPMIMDPSHIGGKASIVKELIQEFQDLPWVSGQLIEVHPDPEHARTDAKQQLTWEELGSILKEPV